MTPDQRNTYKLLNFHLQKAKDGEELHLLEAVKIMLKDRSFAVWISKDKTLPAQAKTAADLYQVCQRYLYRLLYARDYAAAAAVLWGEESFTAEPHSVQLIWKGLHNYALNNVMGCASAGKCLGKGTPVMLFDGTIKPVEEIQVGDQLMGDDSTPRRVLSLARGREKLYRVNPSHGDSWVCNESHILSVKCSTERKTRHGRTIRGWEKGAVRDMSVKDYLSSSKHFQRYWKQYRVPVHFEKKPTTVDPYCYGAWLADGGVNLPVRFDGPNPCADFVKTSFINGEKRILREYLTSDDSDRAQLLAGLLDGDGSVADSGFEISTKYPGLAEDILFLARSLGLYARCTDKVATIKEAGFSATYKRIYIGGDFSKIPTLAKHPSARCNRDQLLQQITLEDLGEGDYYGFTIDGNHRFLLGDFTVTHNTFSAIAWALLDWQLDPDWTCVLLVGPDSDHLKRNMFGDLVRLHESAVIPLAGKVDTESLSTDKKRGMGFFQVALDRGPSASAKLKGAKTKPRSGYKHPLFGRSTRLRLLIDEAQQVPVNAWGMIVNLISNKESEEHLKVFCAANPSDEFSRYGLNCKPSGGWGEISKTQETWTSETGWHVVRINAMLTENVQQRRVIYARMIDYDKVQAIIRACGGDDEAPEVYTQVYGMFPPKGSMASIIQRHWLDNAMGEWLFDGMTVGYAGFDPAFTGDLPALAIGRFGRASAWRDFTGKTHMLKEAKWVLQIDSVGILPRGDSQDLADEVFSRMKILGIKPECFAIDRTGAGTGVHDIVRRQWRIKVDGVNPNTEAAQNPVDICGIHYSEKPTTVKIAEEDTETPDLMFDRICSELWFAMARLMEFDCIRIGRVDPKAIEELSSRRGGTSTTRSRRRTVEPKDSYKARGHSSPDRADAITMLVHAARVREAELRPRAADTPAEREIPMDLNQFAQSFAGQFAPAANYKIDLKLFSEDDGQVGDAWRNDAD